MIKSLVTSLFSKFGLQVKRVSVASPPPEEPVLSGPLLFGRFVVETNDIALLKAYRDFPEFNGMIGHLVEILCHKGPIALIDIGANCGDTLAIAKAASPESEVLCVEGDGILLPSLEKNARQFTGITIKHCYLGEVSGSANVFVQNRGWNSTLVRGQADELISLERLDDVALSWTGLSRLRFIKCDAEGYDISILFGAQRILNKYKPVVLFEYNREAMRLTGEKGFRIFSYLAELGYRDVLFYDNFGRFLLAADLLQGNLLQDLHDYVDGRGTSIYYYDIIAFPDIEKELLAELLRKERNKSVI
jgi:FkbM family methyltransferase